VEQHVAGLDRLLQLRRGYAGERDAVVVAEIDKRVTMRRRSSGGMPTNVVVKEKVIKDERALP
jgi:hypothetical protein